MDRHNNNETETSSRNFKKRKLVINQGRFERFEILAEVNPITFKKIWIFYQYQQFKGPLDFKTAIDSVWEYLGQNYQNRGIRNPTLPQVLNRMQQAKNDTFIEYFTREVGFDLLGFIIGANVESLLYGDDFLNYYTVQLNRGTLELPSDIWNTLLNEGIDELRKLDITISQKIDSIIDINLQEVENFSNIEF